MRYWKDRHKPRGAAEGEKRGPAISRQKRRKLNRDQEYLAMQAIYLEENTACANCGNRATQVHHIVCGTAGRARSLLNVDTWLGVCDVQCHEAIEAMSVAQQVAVKQAVVAREVERLRK